MIGLLVFWLFNMSVVTFEGKKDYDNCKKEDFKPKACEKWSNSHEPADRNW